MGLSTGGFFKNFVKGAAQQYNANIAYVRKHNKLKKNGQKRKKQDNLGMIRDLRKWI
jgi:hypothetical protein